MAHLGSILEVVGSMLAPYKRYVGPFGRKSWHWMGWWGYAKRQELFYKMIEFFYFQCLLMFMDFSIEEPQQQKKRGKP